MMISPYYKSILINQELGVTIQEPGAKEQLLSGERWLCPPKSSCSTATFIAKGREYTAVRAAFSAGVDRREKIDRMFRHNHP